MLGKCSAVVYDLDSTVAHTQHRWHLTPKEGNNLTWADYSMACKGDTPLEGTVARMRLDWPQHEVHICSGRSGEALELTKEWLAEHGVRPWYDYLALGEIGDTRSNAQIKIDYIKHLEASGRREVVLVYEDWDIIAREIRAATGVPVLGVNPFYIRTEEERGGL